MQSLVAALTNKVSVQFDPELTGSEGTGLSDGVVVLKASEYSDTVLPVAFKLVGEDVDVSHQFTKNDVLAAVQTALADAEFKLHAFDVRFAKR
jgi:hypothetical protein